MTDNQQPQVQAETVLAVMRRKLDAANFENAVLQAQIEELRAQND